ncbi:BBE domain-containing protein [Paenibacillus phytohabitans]
MVDAKGRIIIANKNSNADLLWASRGGGGGNFGVCTRYKFKVRPAPATATVFRITWPWNQFEKVLKAWQRWAPSVNTRLGSELSIGPKKGGNVSMLGLFLGSKAEAVRLLKPITDVGTPTNQLIRSLPYPKVVSFLLAPDPVQTQRFSNQFSSGFGRKPFPDTAIKSMREFLENVEGEFAGFYFLNWGGAVSRKSPRSTAFYWRKAKFYVEWNSSWVKKSDAAKNIAIVRNTRRKLQPFIVGSYINVPDQGIKHSGPVYYGANYPRLRRVKAKYDPGNVFNNPQSIPPARKV